MRARPSPTPPHDVPGGPDIPDVRSPPDVPGARRASGARLVPVVVALSLALASGTVAATEVGRGRSVGLGLSVGEPGGFAGKLFLDQRHAIDVSVGFPWYGGNCTRHALYCGYDTLSLGADTLWQQTALWQTADVELGWHIGVGGRAWFWDFRDEYGSTLIDASARAPLGFDLWFRSPAFLEVFLEATPSIYIINRHGPLWGIESSLGVRFYL